MQFKHTLLKNVLCLVPCFPLCLASLFHDIRSVDLYRDMDEMRLHNDTANNHDGDNSS